MVRSARIISLAAKKYPHAPRIRLGGRTYLIRTRWLQTVVRWIREVMKDF